MISCCIFTVSIIQWLVKTKETLFVSWYLQSDSTALLSLYTNNLCWTGQESQQQDRCHVGSWSSCFYRPLSDFQCYKLAEDPGNKRTDIRDGDLILDLRTPRLNIFSKTTSHCLLCWRLCSWILYFTFQNDELCFCASPPQVSLSLSWFSWFGSGCGGTCWRLFCRQVTAGVPAEVTAAGETEIITMCSISCLHCSFGSVEASDSEVVKTESVELSV